MQQPPSTAIASRLLGNPATPRVLPFALLMLLIGIEELCRSHLVRHLLPIPDSGFLYFYPFRVIVAGGALLYALRRCDEVRLRDLAHPLPTIASILTGLATFALWINMDWLLPFQSASAGFDPTPVGNDTLRTGLIIVRIFGAATIIPPIEELFWRSFLIRYLINTDFTSVPIGTLTAPAFILATVLFGLEHQLIIAGLMAGTVYTLLLRFTGSVAHCILAHAVTNLALGLFVITRHAWYFW